MKLLYLLRHGESEGNRDNKFRGRADFDLTDNGRKQAEQAGRFLKGTPFDAIYSSPLKRAQDTALIINTFLNTKIIVDHSFNNIRLGSWEGKPKDFVRERFPAQWHLWIKNPESLNVEGMETLDEVMERSLKKVNEIRESYSGNVLVVTHRAVLKPLIAGLLGIEKPYFWKVNVDAAAISIIEWMDSERGWMLKNLNVNHYLDAFIEERY